MTTRNILSLIGGLCVAIGPVMQINAPSPTMFWLGMVLNAAGGALLASKAFTSLEEKK